MLPKISRSEARKNLGIGSSQQVICWMPGSRKQEVRRLLPVMQKIKTMFSSDCLHLQPMAIDYLKTNQEMAGVRTLPLTQRYEAMVAADMVIGASGNMVLEAALLGTPVTALYQVSGLTYAVARQLVKMPWITLPNILLERAVVPEYIQYLCPEEIFRSVQKEILEKEKWKLIQGDLQALLGPEHAMDTAAQYLLTSLNRKDLLTC